MEVAMINDAVLEGIIVRTCKYADDLLFRLAYYRTGIANHFTIYWLGCVKILARGYEKSFWRHKRITVTSRQILGR
jgi:hypothetical protein